MPNFDTARKPEIPAGIVGKWQRLLNLMAETVGVPAGLIMKNDPPQIEVYISSETEGNPYHKGERANLNTGLYCETVMQKRESLLVPDATKDPKWNHNPDIELGMVYYLGFPLEWPDNQIFGTICVLDYKDNPKSTEYKELIFEFSEIIRTDLENIAKKYELECEKEKLKGSEEKFRELFDNMANGVAVYDAIDGGNDFVFKDMNKSGQKVSKVDITKIKGKSILEVFPGVKDLGLFDIFKKVYKTGKSAYLPTTLYKDNRIFQWVDNYIYKLPSGEIVAVYDDITEKMNIEKQLKESEEKHRTLFETMIQGVVYQDADGNIISANPSSEKILGLTLDQMKGRTSIDPRWRSIHEDGTDFPGDTHPSMATLKTGKEVNSVMGVFNPKYEEYRWININAVPLFRNNDKKPYLVYTTFEDITKAKKAEEKINSLNEALRVLNKILRHDILNDLTVVMSACDMIQVDDETMKLKAAKAIKKSVSLIEQMRALENALVSDEALAGKSLGSAVESVVKNYPDIKFNIKGDCTVLCDGAIYSVIDNIVRNSVVHGKTDRIDITIDDNCEMRIVDFGKGIPSDVKDKIFGEGESFGETRGSGLGLYIVKKVMERYGGEISFEGNKPNGAVFVLKFKKA